MGWQLVLFIVVMLTVGALLALMDGYVEYMGGPSSSPLTRWLIALAVGVIVALVITGIASLF